METDDRESSRDPVTMDWQDWDAWRTTALEELDAPTAFKVVRYMIAHNPYLEDWHGPDGRFGGDVYDEIVRLAQEAP